MTEIEFEPVASYQHQGVIERLQRTTGIDEEKARTLFEDTKKFLYLSAKYEQPMIPTKAIDEGWHNFILFTQDYEKFCKSVLGKFVHHQPTPPSEQNPDRQKIVHASTLRIAKSEFLGELSENWTKSSLTCCTSEDGGTTNCQDAKCSTNE